MRALSARALILFAAAVAAAVAAAIVAVSPRGSPAALRRPSAAAQDSTDSSPVPNIAGQWTIAINQTIVGVVCETAATADIVQSGRSFRGPASGKGTCGLEHLSSTFSESLTITDGRISGEQVTFRVAETPACWYEGTASGNPPNRMGGTMICVAPQHDGKIHRGTWWAGRR